MQGHLRRRGKRSWSIVLDVGRDERGKRRQKWHTVHGTKKDAEREMARLMTAVHTGTYVEPTHITVGEYLDRWLEDYARPNVAGTTFERYEQVIQLHLKPVLGHHLLAKLQPLHIQACYSAALQNGRRDGRPGGLSALTVLHHHRILREAPQHAVRWQLRAGNPADAVEPPRPRRKEMRALDEEQTAYLLTLATGTTEYMPILLAATTGMRRGEVLAVRWSDIDLDRGALAVRQSLEQTKKGLSFKEPKRPRSRRVVALPEFVVEELRRHRAEQAKTRLALGTAYRDHGLVCARADGGPMYPETVSHAFLKVVRKSGLPSVRFHDLRHGHATHLLRQDVHPKVVSERLGHSTVGITLDIYSHVLPGMQEEAARRIDSALRAALANQRRK